MPARDLYHDVVKRSLVKDGWTITHDPLVLKWGAKDLYVDLGAERLLAAERRGERIAIEVKSFLGPSDVDDLEKALGQFILYHDLLAERDPDRILFLAVSIDVWRDIFEEPIGELLLAKKRLRVLVFDPKEEEILRWTS
ncbi:MAG: XisH protein [Phycisphaerales bacterium]|nr:XisH protein [Phycisphaerales bacterium]